MLADTALHSYIVGGIVGGTMSCPVCESLMQIIVEGLLILIQKALSASLRI